MVTRKKYDRDFKLSVARAAVEGKTSVPELVSELDLSATTVRRWITEYQKLGDKAFPGHGRRKQNKDFEIAKLKAKIDELEMERDILKNYQAFLKKNRM